MERNRVMKRWDGFLGRMIPGELCALCSPPDASGSVGMDLNTEKEHAWKLPFGGGLWLAAQNHIKWTQECHQNTDFFFFFSIFLQLKAARALFLLSVQGVLNTQRCLGLKDVPVFPSFVNLRAVKRRDVFTWANHSITLLSSSLLFAIAILLFLLKSWCWYISVPFRKL